MGKFYLHKAQLEDIYVGGHQDQDQIGRSRPPLSSLLKCQQQSQYHRNQKEADEIRLKVIEYQDIEVVSYNQVQMIYNYQYMDLPDYFFSKKRETQIFPCHLS